MHMPYTNGVARYLYCIEKHLCEFKSATMSYTNIYMNTTSLNFPISSYQHFVQVRPKPLYSSPPTCRPTTTNETPSETPSSTSTPATSSLSAKSAWTRLASLWCSFYIRCLISSAARWPTMLVHSSSVSSIRWVFSLIWSENLSILCIIMMKIQKGLLIKLKLFVCCSLMFC